jgi:hypothetical protein
VNGPCTRGRQDQRRLRPRSGRWCRRRVPREPRASVSRRAPRRCARLRHEPSRSRCPSPSRTRPPRPWSPHTGAALPRPGGRSIWPGSAWPARLPRDGGIAAGRAVDTDDDHFVHATRLARSGRGRSAGGSLATTSLILHSPRASWRGGSRPDRRCAGCDILSCRSADPVGDGSRPWPLRHDGPYQFPGRSAPMTCCPLHVSVLASLDTTYGVAALWVGLAMLASVISIRAGLSVALVEILVGVVGGNLLGMTPKRVDRLPRRLRQRPAHLPRGGGDRSGVPAPFPRPQPRTSAASASPPPSPAPGRSPCSSSTGGCMPARSRASRSRPPRSPSSMR